MNVTFLFTFLGDCIRRFVSTFDIILLPFFLISIFFLTFKIIRMLFPVRSDFNG